jgi:hypothetical protein
VPLAAGKSEGTHAHEWVLPAAPAPIAMATDSFMDGAVYHLE